MGQLVMMTEPISDTLLRSTRHSPGHVWSPQRVAGLIIAAGASSPFWTLPDARLASEEEGVGQNGCHVSPTTLRKERPPGMRFLPKHPAHFPEFPELMTKFQYF